MTGPKNMRGTCGEHAVDLGGHVGCILGPCLEHAGSMGGTCGKHAGDLGGHVGFHPGAMLRTCEEHGGNIGENARALARAWGNVWGPRKNMWGSCRGEGVGQHASRGAGACNGPCAMGSKTNHLYPQRGKL